MRGAKVIMACRDMTKCESVRKEIVIESSNKYIYCRKCDLASMESIKQFAKRFNEGNSYLSDLQNFSIDIDWLVEESRLDILINNAGVMRCPKSLTSEGIEMQLGVNHMGHFLLTYLLLDKIKVSFMLAVILSRITNLVLGYIWLWDFFLIIT